MEFKITQEISEVILQNGSIDVIAQFSELVSELLKVKDYGTGLQTICIGIICVGPEFDSFFKIRKPNIIKTKPSSKTVDHTA